MRNKSFPPSAELLQYHPVQHVLEVNTIRIVGWGGGKPPLLALFCLIIPYSLPPPTPTSGPPPKRNGRFPQRHPTPTIPQNFPLQKMTKKMFSVPLRKRLNKIHC